MAQLFVVDQNGHVLNNNVASIINLRALGKNIDAEKNGWVYTWQEVFTSGTYNLPKPICPEVLTFGTARAYLHASNGIGGLRVTARIECTDPAVLEKAIEIVVKYVGGKVSTFDLNQPAQPNSFVDGVRNDLKRLWHWVRYNALLMRRRILLRLSI
ncbi:MAG: hypothetical protein Q7R69_01835 [bacterium]|nr:hypothetical protein [bacterium]